LVASNGCTPPCDLQNGVQRIDKLLASTAIGPPHKPKSEKKQEPFALTPRPYQTDLMGGIGAEYRTPVLSVLMQLATGAGKTFIFCRIAAGAIAKGKRDDP
jgi:superfamily II DNA or RNA helicase